MLQNGRPNPFFEKKNTKPIEWSFIAVYRGFESHHAVMEISAGGSLITRSWMS